MKILVLGSSGMLGSKFLDIANKFINLSFVGLDLPSLDITNAANVSEKLALEKPDILINCAAYTNVDDCEKNVDLAYSVNAKGPEILALTCQKLNIPLVHFSTDYVFDGMAKMPYETEYPTEPVSIYGKSKLAGEIAIKNRMEKYYIIRTAWLYGENGQNFVQTILKLANKLDSLTVVNDQIGSPTCTLDLALATIELIKKEKYGTYHITNSGFCSWFDFAKEILEQKNINKQVLPCTSDQFVRPAKRPNYSVLSLAKINQLNIFTRVWQKALADYLNPLS